MHERTIVVTGATSGLGRVAALHCAAVGANVVACGRRADLGHTLIDEITAAGGTAIFVEADVARSEQVKALIDAAVQTYGKLDYAFNNAGIFQREPRMHEYDDELWAQHLAVGLTGVYLCMKHQLAAMLENPVAHCAIVNNASTVGLRGSEASGAGYTAAKHGVIGLTRQAAIEYADTHIRVNAICPGPTMSEATAPLLDQDEDALRAFLSGLNPTAELVDAQDIARTLQFLCSDAATMINGHALPLDGGQWAKL